MNIPDSFSGTPELTDHQLLCLRKAGFNLKNPEHIEVGLLCYMATHKLKLAIKGTTSPTVGRNASCPCGSGKKFKKCCINKQIPASPEDTLPLPEELSNPFDKAWNVKSHEMLLAMLQHHKDMIHLRFPYEAVLHWLEKHSTLPENQDDYDDYVAHFMKTTKIHPPIGFIQSIQRAFGASKDASERRVLAFVYMICGPGYHHSKKPNIINSLLFRLTLAEITGVANGLGDNMENTTPSMRLMTQRFLEDSTHSIQMSILAKDFPVLLPFPFMLPTMILMANNMDLSKDTAVFRTIMEEAIGTMLSEDLSLYESALQRWLKANPDDRRRIDVRCVYDLVRFEGHLEPFAFNLMTATMGSVDHPWLPGEEKAAPGRGEDVRDPVVHKRYAKFLEKKGYPQLAERTRNLVKP